MVKNSPTAHHCRSRIRIRARNQISFSAETREYEEEGGDGEEYADDAAAEADRREFEELMAKIKGGQGQAQGQAQGGPAVGAGVGAAAAAAARRPIPEEEDDEGAEEIDTE